MANFDGVPNGRFRHRRLRARADFGAAAQRAQAAAAPLLGHALLARPPLDDESVPVTLADGKVHLTSEE